MQGVHQECLLSLVLYIIAAEMLANFIDADKRIKRIQMRNQQINLVNFSDGMTIFLGYITYLNRIQVILKLYKETSSSKINFSKIQAL